MSHTINDLRAALFAQLDNLRNPARDVDQEVNRARAITDVSRTILESAKIEIEHSRMLGGVTVEFLATESTPAVRQIATGTVERVGNVTRHRAA